jgi:hypothetical protein
MSLPVASTLMALRAPLCDFPGPRWPDRIFVFSLAMSLSWVFLMYQARENQAKTLRISTLALCALRMLWYFVVLQKVIDYKKIILISAVLLILDAAGVLFFSEI